MCRVLEVARSAFYTWRRGHISPLKQANKALLIIIWEIFEESCKTYGVPRVYKELRRRGNKVNYKRVERIMQNNGISPITVKKFRPQTTRPCNESAVVSDKVHQLFFATAPNEVVVSDITYIPTENGWVYLVVFIDLFSRMVKGWHVGNRLTADLVVTGLRNYKNTHKLTDNPIFHSDRGVQYTSKMFRAEIGGLNAQHSMGRRGNCYDNSVAESFFATLKKEAVRRLVYSDLEHATSEIFRYIEGFYNTRRIHSGIGYLTPIECEKLAG